MNELITSVCSITEFSKYTNRIIYDFKPKECDIHIRNFEPRECRLLFMVKYFSLNYAIEFENNCFFLKINFEIDDDKYPSLRSEFYQKINFLLTDEKFHKQEDNLIILKSKIDLYLIKRAHIIFATERGMKTYFFLETKFAIEEMVAIVFSEFKEIMTQIWKTVYENFETVELPHFFKPSESIPKDYLVYANNANPYNLSPIVKIYFDSYQKQKFQRINNVNVMPKENKNWIKRIYIFMKKLKRIKV